MQHKNHFYYTYIWKWSKDKSTPENWICATPIKLFGYCIGWKVKIVKRGYEKYHFTNHPEYKSN